MRDDLRAMPPEEALRRMLELRKSGDPEASHVEADELLLRTLLWFSHRDPEGSVKLLVEAFADVPAWYA